MRGFPKDAGTDSIGSPKLIVKAASGEPPQWRWISQRSTAVSMTSAKCLPIGKRTGCSRRSRHASALASCRAPRCCSSWCCFTSRPTRTSRCSTSTASAGLSRRVSHIHQDTDLGYGWGIRGERFYVASSSPGLAAKTSFYGLYRYNEGQVRLWPYPRANGEHTADVLRRLRAEFPDGKLVLIWDGAPYHRATAVRAAAADLGIELAPLPGYSPDLMPVQALWRWLREDAPSPHCHPPAEDLIRRVAAFEARINQHPCKIADRLWVKHHLDQSEEKLRFSK